MSTTRLKLRRSTEGLPCERDTYKRGCCYVIDRAEEAHSNRCKANKIDGLPGATRTRKRDDFHEN